MTVEQAGRTLLEWLTSHPDEAKAQKSALEYYGQYFSVQNLKSVTQEGFRDFLLIKNNRHWAGIHRQPQIYQDMDRLLQCLGILLDESKPIEHRLDRILPKGKPSFLPGMGRAVLTPILMCVYPEKYAVYNRISAQALEMLGRNNVKHTDPFSKRYLALNVACHELGAEIQQPLYLIDSMFSLIVHGVGSPLTMLPKEGPQILSGGDQELNVGAEQADSAYFPLEKYLQEFIISNWSKTPLAKSLDLYEEDEETGVEFSTGVGEIDILARDRKSGDWVVIELKKGRNSDAVVGQVLRYMGWIGKHKASPGEKVRGIIITGNADDRIKYAISAIPNIEFFTYRVSFDLVQERFI
jgi:hypothetical protein